MVTPIVSSAWCTPSASQTAEIRARRSAPSSAAAPDERGGDPVERVGGSHVHVAGHHRGLEVAGRVDRDAGAAQLAGLVVREPHLDARIPVLGSEPVRRDAADLVVVRDAL